MDSSDIPAGPQVSMSTLIGIRMTQIGIRMPLLKAGALFVELAFASWHLRGVSDCALAPDPGVESPLFLPHLNTVPLGAETPGIFLPLERPAHRWLGHAQRGYALVPVRCPQHSHLSCSVSCPLRDSLLPLAALGFRVNNTRT